MAPKLHRGSFCAWHSLPEYPCPARRTGSLKQNRQKKRIIACDFWFHRAASHQFTLVATLHRSTHPSSYISESFVRVTTAILILLRSPLTSKKRVKTPVPAAFDNQAGETDSPPASPLPYFSTDFTQEIDDALRLKVLTYPYRVACPLDRIASTEVLSFSFLFLQVQKGARKLFSPASTRKRRLTADPRQLRQPSADSQ